jgi:TPR repeat protein
MRPALTRSVALAAIVLAQACAAATPPYDAYAAGTQAYREKNYTLARAQWERVLAGGAEDPSAENNLGYLLYYGLGGATDQARAIRLWYRASKAGHAEAQWHLGTAFESGSAVPQSKVEAMAWYRCAVANAERRSKLGNKALEETIAADARASLVKLSSKLTEDEIRQGEAIATACIAEQQAHRSGT